MRRLTAPDFVAELVVENGRTPVYVTYERRHCFVVAPVGRRRVATFTAARGRAPFSVPERRNLEPREYIPYNGRARRSGRIALDR